MGCNFSKKPNFPSNYIRVVHMNGHVEDFDYPLTARELTGKSPKQFLCTQAQLISGSLKPLKPEARLEPSHIYFLISYSTLQSESSALDLAITAKRLIKLAKTITPQTKGPPSNGSLTRGTNSRSGVEFGNGSGSWKPTLDTIREKSFSLRSESDFREMHLEVIIQNTNLDLINIVDHVP